MKVLTLKQPWASLVANGYKCYEFRSWKTNYRGEILIHAGAGVDKEALKKVSNYGIEFLTKKILCKAILEDCLLINDEFNEMINTKDINVYGRKIRTGYAWKLSNIRKVNIDEEVKGQLGLWNYDVNNK